MKMQSAVDEYLVEIEVRKYTPKTIRSYRCNLNLFLRFCAEKLHVETVEALTPAVVRQFSRCMSEAGRKGTYINGVLKSIKSFIQYCYEEGYGGFDTRKTFKWCKEEKPVITAFSPEQVRSMLQSCRGHDYLLLRDYAILTLLFETGIRCWELCCIREEDIHNDFIIINGKNHKQRVVPITLDRRILDGLLHGVHIRAFFRHGNGDQLEAEGFRQLEVAVIAGGGAQPLDNRLLTPGAGAVEAAVDKALQNPQKVL